MADDTKIYYFLLSSWRGAYHKFTCNWGFFFIFIVRRTYSEMKRSEIELSVLVRMPWCTYNAQAVPRPKPHKFTCDRGFLFICIVRRTYSEMKRSGIELSVLVRMSWCTYNAQMQNKHSIQFCTFFSWMIYYTSNNTKKTTTISKISPLN